MLELTTYTELEIAHRLLTSYTQKCRALHGHRYEVEITVASPRGLNKDGMIVDFKQLKEVVKEVLDDKWDHGACFNKADRISEFMLKDAERERLHLIDDNPTLEWMVGRWVEDLNAAFRAKDIDLVVTKLKASETAKNTVTWTLDEKVRVFADKPALEVAGLPSQRVDDTKKRLDAALCPAPTHDWASPGATAKVEEVDPDAVPYLVSFYNNHTIGSTVVHSSLKAQALYDFCTGAVQLLDKNEEAVVVIGINRLPG